MASCAHKHWLRVQQAQDGFALQYNNRLSNIHSLLPEPSSQRPSLLFFLGKQSKARALRVLFPGNELSACRTFGIANIGLDHRTVKTMYPILVAESSPHFAQIDLRGESICHETLSYPINWPDDVSTHPTLQYLVDLLHSKLLLLFTDVLCIFAADCGGLDGVAERITSWAAFGSASSLPTSSRPRLLIVANTASHLFEQEALRFQLRVVAISNFSESFSTLRLVNIPGSTRPPTRSMYCDLEQALHQETRFARSEKMNRYILFSATHLTTFFEMALRSFSANPRHTFDFIRCSRQDNPVSSRFELHLASFLHLSLEKRLPSHIIWNFLGSAIVYNAFPTDMHYFHPSEVFHKLYRQNCVNGIKKYAELQQLSVDMICKEVESHIISRFYQMEFNKSSAADIRHESLRLSSKYLQLIQSSVDCFICLQREPEHLMECGHGICDMCVQVSCFSKLTKGREYCYDISNCPQCDIKISFQARILPPTCRVRFLGFDGGGSRGIVSLGFMEKLEEALGLNYPIQDHFDYSIGTSSGGIATIGLFGKNWSPKECLRFFQKFAKIIFPAKEDSKCFIWSILRRLFAFYRQDGKYDAEVLERALKEALGKGLIFGSVEASTSGMKFAVTATTISDATLCLISNYNGGQPESRPRYKHLRPTRMSHEIRLWEAARCTTAAPSYFMPKRLAPYGTLQDGGLKSNNPARPGLHEVKRIWDNSDCDIVLSIGTGYEQKPGSPIVTNVRNFLQDGAIARFYRAAMQSLSLNGQISWEDHWSGLGDEAKHQQFRLNLPLQGKEPDIDDVDKMQYLYDQIQYHLSDINTIARALQAVSFFFELDGPLIFEKGRYVCYGSILSRSSDSRNLVQHLNDEYPAAQFFRDDLSLGFLTTNDICESCGRFRKCIKFHVRHPTDRVNIHIVFNRLYRRSISGFPQCIDWFSRKQKLSTKFGLSDHKSRLQAWNNRSCACEPKHSHSIPSLASSQDYSISMRRRRKRRRLL